MNMPVACPADATPAPLSGLGRSLHPDLGTEVRAIIEQGMLSILFQPIVAPGENTIHGYEALTRGPSDSALHAPGSLFNAACQAGLLLELEQQCWRLAHDRFVELGLPGRLFLNTSSRSLIQPGQPLLRALRGTGNPDLRPERVVIEITEQYPIDDFAAVMQAASDYRILGFQLAIDDLGAGYSGLRLWSELRPDYVKIDAHFLQRVHEDPIKQEFIRSIRDIALGTKSHVVAEGIETASEYQMLLQLGIGLGQGYYFSRPKSRPPRELAQEPMEVESRNRPQRQRLSETIGTLALSVPTVTPDTTVDEAVTLLQQNPDLHTLPLLVENRPISAVRRQRLMELYLKQYARELYGRRPVTRFMDRHPLVVEHDLPVERVSQKITNQLNFEIEHQFIITRNGEYLGIGLVRDLLKKITDLQIRNARYANPLTLMPGNVPIYEQIDLLLEEQQAFAVCYCDLDHFKPYNDSYGYTRGDDVIQKLAQILCAHIDEHHDFAGHIGGDDFILIFTSPNWRERCEHILRHFERERVQFYNDADLAQGGLWGYDRQGNNLFFPLLSLSIGAITPDVQRCQNHHQVATLATEAKRQAKKMTGNSLFIERRRAPAPLP